MGEVPILLFMVSFPVDGGCCCDVEMSTWVDASVRRPRHKNNSNLQTKAHRYENGGSTFAGK